MIGVCYGGANVDSYYYQIPLILQTYHRHRRIPPEAEQE